MWSYQKPWVRLRKRSKGAWLFSKSGLTRSLGSDYARDLREHGFSRIFVDLKDISVSIDATNFAKLFIVLNDWQVFLGISVKSFVDCINVVVRATLATSENSVDADIFAAIEEQDTLSLADVI